MIRQVLGLTALFGLGVQGFMIPSTMSLPDVEDAKLPQFSDLIPDFEALTDAPKSVKVEDSNAFLVPEVETITILPIMRDDERVKSSYIFGEPHFMTNIECPECRFSPEELESPQVSLIFSIDGTGEQLLLNGVPLFPLGEVAPTFTAHEKPKDAFLDVLMPSHKLKYQAAIVAGPPGFQAGDQFLDVWYKVTGVDDFETDAEPLKVSIYKMSTGKLGLMEVSYEPEMPPHEFLKPVENAVEACTGPAFFCKLFNIFETKISSWRSRLHSSKPCHRVKGQNEAWTLPTVHGGIPKFTLPPMNNRPFRPESLETDETRHQYHFKHHHHHHPRLHAFLRGVRDFLVGFLIPVLIGIMAGMFASLVGMVLGSLIAWAWIRFVRKGKRGPYARIPTSDDVAEKSSEHDIEGESEEFAPPAYVEKA